MTASPRILCPTPLPASFFQRPTVTVARELLGCFLVMSREQGPPLALKIVETEAYTQDDPACHAYQRTTGRAANLYKAPGTAYVYLIYGMYHCLNVVTEPEGVAGAVLFRALEPPTLSLEASAYTDQSAITPVLAYPKTNGPGRLCKALGIQGEHNGLNLTSAASPFYLSAGWPASDAEIDASSQENRQENQVIEATRIGISQGQERLWRFYLEQSAWVSVRPPRSRTKKAPKL